MSTRRSREEAGERPIRLGVIYPDSAAEDEYLDYAAGALFPLEVRLAHTLAADSHAIPDLLDTASIERLVEGARTQHEGRRGRRPTPEA